MLSRKFSLVLISLLFGIQASAKTQSVELLANDVNKTGNLVEAKGDVVVYSQDYFLTSDKAIYDKDSEVLQLFGNVNSMRSDNKISRANYVKIDMKNKSQKATANFLMDKEAEIWMQNDESCSDKEYYRVKGSVVSSCNVQDPDWRIKFSSGKMNKQSKFLHIFNPVFYLGDVPIFYLPYFGFPTDDTRRTGLLPPEMGYIKKEGFYYKQPIYFAPYESWDFELDPQIRTRRGSGVYGIFRFADSPYSYGELRGGLFDNKKKHQKRLEYKNEVHKGIEFEYDRSKLVGYLANGDFKEHLWMDFKDVNDLEYFDLKSKGGVDEDDSLITSKMNYYLTTDEHYFGLYSRYYIDTDKLNKGNEFQNKDTVQELPTIQYHKFTNSLFMPNLLYSVDTKFKNYTREKGASASQYEFELPLSYSTPLLDDYLNFTFTEGLYATHIDWHSNMLYDNGRLKKDETSDYLNNYHKFALSTDLSKAYGSFYHTINLEADYLLPGVQKGNIDSRILRDYKYDLDKKRGRLDYNRLNNIRDDLYYEDDYLSELGDEYTHENTGVKFTQYFYDKTGRKFIRHSVKQRYDFEDGEFQNLDHRIDFYFSNGLNIGNRFEYSHKFQSFDKVQTYANYSNQYFSTSLTHSYEYQKEDKEENRNMYKDNYSIFNLSINLPEYYKLFGTWEYDLGRSYTKMWRAGVTHNRKCWNYSLVYQENIEPKTTSISDYEKASKEQGIYLFVNFYPFGGIGYDYSVDHRYDEKN